MLVWSSPAGGPPQVGIGDTEHLALRLAQAIAWCAPRADARDPLGSLRDSGLRPRDLEPDRAAAVQDVVRPRATYVPPTLAPVTGADPLAGGRLLAYYTDANLFDGAAELESGGFFDGDNTPPWDTWVGLVEDAGAMDRSYRVVLLAWVPPAFLPAAARGVWANPEGCIAWLADAQASSHIEPRSGRRLR